MSKNEIATTGNGFLTLTDFNITEALSEELTGLDAGFERIKIPSAGSTVFEVPGEDPNEPETVKEFSAVILYHHPLFAYYQNAYVGGNNPPDCGSFDGITGRGMPGGSCPTCPFNQFGSADGGGKACKNRRRMYLLREGEIFPLLLSLPTGSLRDYTRYLKRLLSKGRKSGSVVTRFSLAKATSSGGIAYSHAQFAMDRVLTPEERAVIDRLAEQIKAHSGRVSLEIDTRDTGEMIDPDTGEIIQPLR